MAVPSSTTAQPAHKARSTTRRVLMLALAFLLLGLSLRSATLRGIPVNDFLEYWAAARLEVSGQNPYSQEAMYELEKQYGLKSEKPLMMWNPPWVLPFIAPLGRLALAAARVVVFAVTFVLLFACADWLWRAYGGDPARRWMAWVLTCTFVPAMVSLTSGQVSPIVLLGVAAFLWFQQRGNLLAAGASMLLIAFKPHLLYLLWIAVGLQAVRRRRWRVLSGAAVALAAATAVALAINPAILAQYWAAWKSESMLALYAPPPGGLLRIAFGWQKYWLQFVFAVPAVLWLAWSQRNRKNDEVDGRRDLPLLLAVSVCTSPYGWLFDQVVLLPALLQRAAEFDRGFLRFRPLWPVLYVAANLGIVVLLIMKHGMLSQAYAWTAPVWLLLYLGSGMEQRHSSCGKA